MLGYKVKIHILRRPKIYSCRAEIFGQCILGAERVSTINPVDTVSGLSESEQKYAHGLKTDRYCLGR